MIKVSLYLHNGRVISVYIKRRQFDLIMKSFDLPKKKSKLPRDKSKSWWRRALGAMALWRKWKKREEGYSEKRTPGKNL